MKKKQVLWLVALIAVVCMFLIAACGKAESLTISITNKAALTAAWTEDDADRTIEVELSPAGYTEANTEISVISDNADAVQADGLRLVAAGEGTATITVKAGKAEDSVTITVEPKKTGITIANKQALSASWRVGDPERTLVLSFSGDAFTDENTKYKIESDAPQIVSVSGKTLRATDVGTATITATAYGESDSVTITVEKPELTGITIANKDKFDGWLCGSEKTLEVTFSPEYYNEPANRPAVEIELDAESVVSNDDAPLTLSAIHSGQTTITVRADGDDITDTMTVTTYRKVFAGSDGYWKSEQLKDDQLQTATTTNTDFTFAQFNLAPGRRYYAEATYTLTGPTVENIVGMGHFPGLDWGEDRFLMGCIDRGGSETDRNHKTGDFKTGVGMPGAWTFENMLFSNRLVADRGFKDEQPGCVTYAVARMDDFFYQFVNGQLVNIVTYDYYKNIDTIPGLFGRKLQNSIISNIVFVDGLAAETKLNDVLDGGKGLIRPYVPDASWAGGSLAEGLFTAGATTLEKGVNFVYNDDSRPLNSGMVSPYLYFERDFTLSWEYKSASAIDDVWRWMKMEIRPWDYGEPIVTLGTGSSGSTQWLSLNVSNFVQDNEWMLGAPWSDKSYQNSTGTFDYSEGVRFTVSRRMCETYAEYTMTAQSLKNPAQRETRIVQWNDGESVKKDEHGVSYGARWNEPVLFVWHNENIAGEYANITWSATAV